VLNTNATDTLSTRPFVKFLPTNNSSNITDDYRVTRARQLRIAPEATSEQADQIRRDTGEWTLVSELPPLSAAPRLATVSAGFPLIVILLASIIL
jgi:hypothetical protein